MSRTEWAYQYGDGPMARCSRDWAAGLAAGEKPGPPVTIYSRVDGNEWVATDPEPAPPPAERQRPSAGPAGTRVQGPITGQVIGTDNGPRQ